ncbi:MAG TPA: phosphotransferase [Thermodesulfovibrionales bacterium]|nr:phosphotransferase [Thermodesulfovibrionales bacterium]
MILEMHCHTSDHSGCSNVTAAEVVQRNFDIGLHGTVLTDHHYLWTPEEIVILRRKLEVPDYYLILAGQEVATPELGDVLVYGATASIEKGTCLQSIRNSFPDAAIIWAHPYRHENGPSRDELFNPCINGIEIFNSNHTVAESSRGLRDWHSLKFNAIAGTDTHALSYAGLYPTIFDHPVSTIAELATEIRAGRCRPFFEEIPHSGSSSTRVTEINVGTGKSKDIREKYVIKKHKDLKAWRSAARTTHIMEEIYLHGFDGGKFRIPKPLGSDRESLTVIEQGIKGKTLFEALVESGPSEAVNCLEMAAEWLARLHNCGLQITPPDEFFSNETLRMELYVSAFYRLNHPQTRKAQEIMDKVIETEKTLYYGRPEKLVQGHGDFHPKNIFIGQESDDPSSGFVAAIDFGSSYAMPPAFDVGTFLAQFRNQFHEKREVFAKVSEDVFLAKYMNDARQLDEDFLRQVELFSARTSLSIGYYLMKVGLGESENLWRVLVEAEHRLARLSI